MQWMKIQKTILFKITVIVLCIAITAFTLHRYAGLIQHLLAIDYNWQFELCMVAGMLLFQYPFIRKQSGQLKLEYYFNMLLVSLTGAALLWPLININQFYRFGNTFNLLYFFAVVIIMFFDHKRRVATLQLPVFISYTWILYRFIILIFIL
jgi:hypothetical protein